MEEAIIAWMRKIVEQDDARTAMLAAEAAVDDDAVEQAWEEHPWPDSPEEYAFFIDDLFATADDFRDFLAKYDGKELSTEQ